MNKFTQDPLDKGRTMKEVSKELNDIEKTPEVGPAPTSSAVEDVPPAPPEPDKLPPEALQQDPEVLVSDEDSSDATEEHVTERA